MKYQFKLQEKPEFQSHHLKLGGSNPEGNRIDVSSAYLTRGGKPWIPIMGEFHFSRYDRAEWPEELAKIKAGGITVVSTYLFWIYHEEIEGKFDFSGDNDIRAFVQECKKAGLDVMLRIGPWVHGECRNGGFPDWLVKKSFPLRENHPEYLEKVHIWYEKIAEQVKGLYYKDGGNIVGIQLENECVNNAEHLAVLKKIALECGMEVPLFTVTGWDSVYGAKIPVDDVIPVFGGYCEAPWERHMERLAPSKHYFFHRMRNDTAIGVDLMEAKGEDDWQLPYERYPFATCELGGGIQVTHHRRPIVQPMDVYTIALIKLGVGNNLPGYYMYHGGTNKIGKLSTFQESKATGYPNDYPILSYDFQTAVSEYGEIREQYRLLNLLHMFLQDFQEIFAPMYAVDAVNAVERTDTTSLRYELRTDGEKGFVFISHYQRLTRLEDIKDAVIDTGNVVFPAIDVTGDVSFFMPYGMKLKTADDSDETKASDAVWLRCATVQPVCHTDDTYFFIEIPGIRAEYVFEGGKSCTVEAGINSGFEMGNVKIVTLTWEQAKYLRRLDGGALYLGGSCDLFFHEGKLQSAEPGEYICYKWDGNQFVPFQIGHQTKSVPAIWENVEQPPFTPDYREELSLGGERKLSWKKLKIEENGMSGCKGDFISIDEEYDVAQIYADGKLIADNYYYGRPWRVPVKLLLGKECYLVMSEMKNDFYREF